MTPDISERAFEDAIQAALLRHGPDAPRGMDYTRSVVECIDSYDQMQERVALLKMLALGNRQIEAGRVQPATEVVARLRERGQAD